MKNDEICIYTSRKKDANIKKVKIKGGKVKKVYLPKQKGQLKIKENFPPLQLEFFYETKNGEVKATCFLNYDVVIERLINKVEEGEFTTRDLKETLETVLEPELHTEFKKYSSEELYDKKTALTAKLQLAARKTLKEYGIKAYNINWKFTDKEDLSAESLDLLMKSNVNKYNIARSYASRRAPYFKMNEPIEVVSGYLTGLALSAMNKGFVVHDEVNPYELQSNVPEYEEILAEVQSNYYRGGKK